MFDMFDSLITGSVQEYKGKKYVYLKRVSADYIMVAELETEMPAPVVIIPAKPSEEKQ